MSDIRKINGYWVKDASARVILEQKQDIVDSSLDTSTKTIVGAINELNEYKLNAPETLGTTGQILKLDPSLNPIWQDLVGFETVTIQLEVESGSGSVADVSISVQVEGENTPRLLTTDASGVANTSVGFGLQYTVTFGTIAGYESVTDLVCRASLVSRKLRGIYRVDTTVTQEHVTVWLYYTSNSANRASTVQVTIGSTTTSYPVTTGTTYDTCEFYIDQNQTYTVVFNTVEDFVTPHSQTYQSVFRARTLKTYYIGTVTDTVWIKQSDGSTLPFNDLTLANLHEYFGLRISTSALASQSASFVVPIEYLLTDNVTYTDSGGTTYTTTAKSLGMKQWASKNTLFEDRPCYTSYSAASTDDGDANFDGENNTELFIAEAARRAAAGETLTVPVMTACKNVSYVVNDVSVYGFVGSILQVKSFALKYTDVDILFYNLFGVHAVDINSGNWWSSTQHSQTIAWRLYYGSPDATGYKTNSLQVLPFFAL